ncbi:Uncharacterised protein [Oligella urethralis]|uniref:hypothetical protein n=1 Tax=Oligella urethralis TaxID=90245 RepID=UPI000E07AFAD|nr:hypothetical protein [Oligella urethralis]SUA63416.1 Uncharacterised protein [Oligella urethralis]
MSSSAFKSASRMIIIDAVIKRLFKEVVANRRKAEERVLKDIFVSIPSHREYHSMAIIFKSEPFYYNLYLDKFSPYLSPPKLTKEMRDSLLPFYKLRKEEEAAERKVKQAIQHFFSQPIEKCHKENFELLFLGGNDVADLISHVLHKPSVINAIFVSGFDAEMYEKQKKLYSQAIKEVSLYSAKSLLSL